MLKRVVTVFIIAAAALALSITASAQAKKLPRTINARYFEMVQNAKRGERLDQRTADRIREDFRSQSENILASPSLVGTWICDVAESDTGLPPFQALHTFGSDGTFVETSSLLGAGGEGPAHGVYEHSRRGYVLTFELFVFDPSTGESVGRVRVRASIKMRSRDSFDALTAVDFIELGGNVIEDIDGGPFSGERMKPFAP